MNKSIDFNGQWLGFFAYGPDYGEDLFGEKVQFRLFVDSFNDGEFDGRSIDLDGIGANYEVAEVKGYLKGSFINFTKQFPYSYSLDEAGNTIEDKDRSHPIVSYVGEYNENTRTFSGQWEIRVAIQPVGEYWIEDICTGAWEIRKDE